VKILAAITSGSTAGLKVKIQWGDGTTTSGTIASLGGVLTVSGSHPYSSTGTFQIRLTVTNASGLSTTVATHAAISRHRKPAGKGQGHDKSNSSSHGGHGQ
jgi:hypothetical protein